MEYQELQKKMHVSPYNVYGTPEHQEIEIQLEELYEQEQGLWDSMKQSERRAEIDKAIDAQIERGLDGFGNCWAGGGGDA